MVVFALLIINKAGGLIYNRTFSPGLQKLSSNDYLILAGTFHGIHAISRSLSPIASPPAPPGTRPQATTGIQNLESSHFRLTCFQTATGTKFLLFTSPEQPNTESVARRCYEIYAEYVMGNPFYNLEMPIRVDKFEKALAGITLNGCVVEDLYPKKDERDTTRRADAKDDAEFGTSSVNVPKNFDWGGLVSLVEDKEKEDWTLVREKAVDPVIPGVANKIVFKTDF